MLTKKVLIWTEEKHEEVTLNPYEKHPLLKSFGLGAVEGVVDGLIINGIMFTTVGVVALVKNAMDHTKK